MESILARVMATVLGLIALAAVVFAMDSANNSSKINMMTASISQLVTEARAQYAMSSTGYASFTTANTAALATAKIIPDRLMLNGSAVDLWGNPITFNSVSSANNYEFQITFGGANIPVETCVGLVTNIGGYVDMTIGGQDMGNLPPDPITAENACTNSTQISLTYL